MAFSPVETSTHGGIDGEGVESSSFPDSASGVILREPTWTSKGLRKGVLVCNQVVYFRETVPRLADVFWIVERWGWRGANRSCQAHVMLVDDVPAQRRWNRVSSAVRLARRLTPWPATEPPPVYVPIGNADFVDTESFSPDSRPKTHDVIMVARWDPFKCHDLLLDAFRILVRRQVEVRGLMAGHIWATSATELRASREHHARIVNRIRNERLPIDLPFADGVAERPDELTATAMAARINGARMGVILAKFEGINRFKMECLACDVPVIICSDACWTLRKHVTPLTGVAVPRRAEALADAILGMRNRTDFQPRAHVMATSGCERSMKSLQATIDALDANEGQDPAPLARYDGRNATLIWKDFAARLRSVTAECVALRHEGG